MFHTPDKHQCMDTLTKIGSRRHIAHNNAQKHKNKKIIGFLLYNVQDIYNAILIKITIIASTQKEVIEEKENKLSSDLITAPLVWK